MADRTSTDTDCTAAPTGPGMGVVPFHATRTARVVCLAEHAVRRAAPGGCRAGAGSGAVVPFPIPLSSRFTPAVRTSLRFFAARFPGLQPLVFGDNRGHGESCRFGNGLVISWDATGRIILTDKRSGYVDHGPFDDLSEACLLVVSLER